MFFVYAIKSQHDGRLYVGLTANMDRRLREHNAGYQFSTKGYRPWTLVYLEELSNRKDARKREKYLKSGIGKEFLKSHINKPG